jgi:hypothetical protein
VALRAYVEGRDVCHWITLAGCPELYRCSYESLLPWDCVLHLSYKVDVARTFPTVDRFGFSGSSCQ